MRSATVNLDSLRDLVDEGHSIRQIAKELGFGYSTVRYWLGKAGLETVQGTRRRESKAARKAGLPRTYLVCPTHGRIEFSARRSSGYRCVKCNSTAVSKRRRQVKRQLVDEAGGACRLCGYDEHPAALQFHHLNPKEKEFHLGHQGLSRGIARMRAEAEKCILLCANCHALVEVGVKKVTAEDR